MTDGSPYRTAAAEDPPPPGRLLLWAALTPLVAVGNVVVTGVMTMLHPVFGVFVPCLVALGWSIATVVGAGGGLARWLATVMLLATTGLGSGFTGAGEMALWLPGGDRSPAELPSAGLARMFTLRDAETRPELFGTYRVQSKKSTSSYAVVPLVPPGWTRAEPVPAWAVCPDTSCRTVTAQPRFGVRAVSFHREHLENACGQASWWHSLRVAPGAPVLEVGASAGDVLRRRAGVLIGVSAALGVAWLLTVVIEAIQGRRAGRRAQGSEPV